MVGIAIGVGVSAVTLPRILDLRFAQNGSLDSRITFTRASTGTYFDAAGVMQTAASGVARFDHDPVAGTARGLLIEESRTNLLSYSAQFDNAAWTKMAGVAVAANQVTAPDGTATGDRVTADSGYGVYQTVSATSGAAYTVSYYVRGGTAPTLMLRDDTGAGRHIVVSTATWTVQSTSGTLLGYGVQPAGGGWYRLYISYTTDTTTARGVLRPDSAGTGQTFYAWGGQIEAGATPTSYIATTSAAATRSADVASMLLADVPGWNASAFTAVAEAEVGAIGAAGTLLYLCDGTSSNQARIVRSAGGNASSVIASGGALQANLSSAATYGGGIVRMAVAAAANDFAFASAGTLGTPDTAGLMPVGMTQLRLGSSVLGAQFLNGWSRRLEIYDTHLSPAQIQGLTA